MKQLYFIFLCSWSTLVFSQNPQRDSIQNFVEQYLIPEMSFDCEIIQGQTRLKGKSFASSTPIYLAANNNVITYGVLQMGKRKDKIYLYMRVLESSVCLRKKENMDVIFSSGETIRLKNQYPVNCEGIFTKELSSSELEKIRGKEVMTIRLYAYNKDYEFHLNSLQKEQLQKHIYCLKQYLIR